MKITFVCTGNTCRSQIAMQYSKQKAKELGLGEVKINSFGLFVAPESQTEPKALDALKKLGVNARSVKAKQLSSADIKNSDFVLTMTAAQAAKVSQITKGAVFCLGDFGFGHDIADPYGGSKEDYYRAAHEIAVAVDNFISVKLV